mmetsp:Transcript_60202/g.113622  ORF Transcript_60202/g.113622 Transcript_60202/m.113622 type:complete len:161 (-) Transcript_60202:68-550(-)
MALVVPSDITIMENKKTIGKRRLGILEMTGLLLTPPMLHLHYSKMDRSDMKAVLSKKYDEEDISDAGVICKKRQESVRKHVVATNYMWGTSGGIAFLVLWSFRRYDWKARAMAIPFLFYGGTFVGRALGDVITFRNAEYGRDRFLGQLPAKVYYTPPAED